MRLGCTGASRLAAASSTVYRTGKSLRVVLGTQANMDTGCCRACQLVTALRPDEDEGDGLPVTEVRRRTRSRDDDNAADTEARTPALRPKDKKQAQLDAHVSASRPYSPGETDTESEDDGDASPTDVLVTPHNGTKPAPQTA